MIVHGCLNVKKKKRNCMHCPFDQYHVLQVVAKNKDFNCIYIQQIREIRTFLSYFDYLKKYIYQSSISNRKTLCADFICRLHLWKETIRIQVHFHLQWQSMLTEQQVDYNWNTLFVKFKEIIFDKLKVQQIFVNKNKEGNTIILFLLPVLYYHFCSIHFPLAVFFLGKWVKVRLY